MFESEKTLLERRSTLMDDMALMEDVRKHEKRKDFSATEAAAWNGMYRELLAIDSKLQEIREDLNPGIMVGERKKKEGESVVSHMMRDLFLGQASRDFTLSGTSATINNPRVQMEWFDSLKANNPLSLLGTRFLAVPNFAQFPVVDTPPAVTWFGEGDTVTPDSSAQITARKVQYKTAVILVNASNFWLEDTDGGLGSDIINRMAISAINEAIIKVALHGSASAGQPVGLDSISNVQSVDAGGALTSYAKPLEAVTKLLRSNVEREKIGYIGSPMAWEQMQNLIATDQGQYLIPPPGLADLRGYYSSAVLENYGTGEDETRMYFGDFSNLMVAASGPRVQILRERYADQMQTGFLIHLRIDTQVIHPDTFCILNGIAPPEE
jgi:HK97 family phage major capsid protein